MGIVSHLLKQPQPWIRDDRLLVPRERLVAMLDRYPYLTATDKLTTWRALHWIDADQEHFTRPARDECGALKRVVMLDIAVYKKLCELREAVDK